MKMPAIPFSQSLKIRVERFLFKSDCTIGKLYVNDIFVCYTMEDEIRDKKVKGETAVPYGVYKLGLRYSPKFTPVYGHDMIHIMNVPGFEYILLHPGNTDYDTDGCLLVGDSIGRLNNQDAVLNSKDTYKALYPVVVAFIKAGVPATIEYTKHI